MGTGVRGGPLAQMPRCLPLIPSQLGTWPLSRPPLPPPRWRPSVQSRWGAVDQSPPRPRPQVEGSGPRDTPTSAPDHIPQSSLVLVNSQ